MRCQDLPSIINTISLLFLLTVSRPLLASGQTLQCHSLFDSQIQIPKLVLQEFSKEDGIAKYMSLAQLQAALEAGQPYSPIYLEQAEKFAAAGKHDFVRDLLFQIQEIPSLKHAEIAALPLRLLGPDNFEMGPAFWQLSDLTRYVKYEFHPDSKIGLFFRRLAQMNLESFSPTQKNLALAIMNHLYGSVDRFGRASDDLHPFLEENFPQALQLWPEERLKLLLDFFNQVNRVVVSVNSSAALSQFAERLDFPLQTDRFLNMSLAQFKERSRLLDLAQALVDAKAGGGGGMPEASLIAGALLKNPKLESHVLKILRVLQGGVEDRIGFRLAAVGNYLKYCTRTNGEGLLDQIGFKMLEAGVLDRPRDSDFILHMDLIRLESQAHAHPELAAELRHWDTVAQTSMAWSPLRQNTFIEVINYLTDMGTDAEAIKAFMSYKAYSLFLEPEDSLSLQNLYEALRPKPIHARSSHSQKN